jgi:hypothetical protein
MGDFGDVLRAGRDVAIGAQQEELRAHLIEPGL